MNTYDAWCYLEDCRGAWPVVLSDDIVGRYVHVERIMVQIVNGVPCVVVFAGENFDG